MASLTLSSVRSTYPWRHFDRPTFCLPFSLASQYLSFAKALGRYRKAILGYPLGDTLHCLWRIRVHTDDLSGLESLFTGRHSDSCFIRVPDHARAMDEVIRRVPPDLPRAAYALGSTNLETAFLVLSRQILPGLATAILLAFGRGIGDAASVLFTAGYTDRLPNSLFSPAASLPLAVFFQLGTPFPEVQQRAYSAALILTIVVLGVSLTSRWLSHVLDRYSIH